MIAQQSKPNESIGHLFVKFLSQLSKLVTLTTTIWDNRPVFVSFNIEQSPNLENMFSKSTCREDFPTVVLVVETLAV